MKTKKITVLELEGEEVSSPNGIVRKSYRIPAEVMGKITVNIYEAQFNVIDIGTEGIGIEISYDGLFTPGEELGAITIHMQRKKFTFQGKVIHVTPVAMNIFHCGVALESPRGKKRQDFGKEVEKLREGVFQYNAHTYTGGFLKNA